MKLTKEAKRCGLFLYFDKHGMVDEYVIRMLEDMNKRLDYTLVICNGYLKSESISKLNQVSNEVLCRANVGFDVGGYREGLFYLGWKGLQEYDEIVFFNYTMMGPIFSFTEMFDAMAEKDLDFWGITKFHKVDGVPFGEISYGYLPEHIQSHFIAVRRDMFISYQYRDFMFNRYNPKDYIEAVCGYEAVFTKHFSDLGFKWEAYADSTELEGTTLYPAVNEAKWMLQNRRCPIIKRRSFFTNYYDFLSDNTGEVTVELVNYIKENNLYDLNMIYDNILRLENMTAIHRNLHLNYFLEDTATDYTWDKKTAIVVLPEKDTALFLFKNLLRRLPDGNKADIYVFGEAKEINAIKNIIPDKTVIYHEAEKSDYIRLLKKAVMILKDKRYDYIGILDLPKIEEDDNGTDKVSYIKNAWKSIAANENVVGNAIKAMEENPRMGMMIPPFAVHGEYFRENEEQWCGRFAEAKKLVDYLEPSVNINENERPLASLSGNFWVRADIIEDIIEKLPDTDKQLAMLVLPVFVQWKLEYVGVAIEKEAGRGDMTNRFYMMRVNNKAIFNNVYAGTHMNVRLALKEYVKKKQLKEQGEQESDN